MPKVRALLVEFFNLSMPSSPSLPVTRLFVILTSHGKRRTVRTPVRALDVVLSNHRFVSGVLHPTGLREDAIRSLLLPALLTLTARLTSCQASARPPSTHVEKTSTFFKRPEEIHCFVCFLSICHANRDVASCRSTTRAETVPCVDSPSSGDVALVSFSTLKW
jgi:hypothetical protein